MKIFISKDIQVEANTGTRVILVCNVTRGRLMPKWINKEINLVISFSEPVYDWQCNSSCLHEHTDFNVFNLRTAFLSRTVRTFNKVFIF